MLSASKSQAKKIYFLLEKYPFIQKISKWIYIKLNTKNNRYQIRGKNNLIQTQDSILNKVTFDVRGNNNQIIIGKHTILKQTRFIIKGDNHSVVIGENCRINKNGCIWLADSNCQLSIGKNTTIESAAISVTENGSQITIGESCMLSNNVDIRCGDSHSIIDRQTGQRINFAENVVIKDRVWLGQGVTVLKGVTIGEDSIIGVGSIVTKDIPHHSIAVGVPAKVVKNNVTWVRETIAKN